MKKILSIILVFGILFSCTKLEEEVFSEISPTNFYQNADDANGAVVSIYNALNRTIDLWDFGMTSMTFMPAPHTLSRVSWRASFANYQISASEGPSLPMVWNAFYRAISRANVAISELESRTFSDSNDDAIREQMIAEAKWLRAYCYFNLVRLWGPVPMPLEAASDLESAKLSATPIEGIYAQIITDLTEAESNLPPSRQGENKGRPIIGTAKFLLAKVYLTMAGLPVDDDSKLPMAHQKIKEVIDNAGAYGYALLDDYETAIRTEQNDEVVFSIHQTQSQPGQGNTMAFIWGGPNWPSDRGPFGGQYHAGYSKDFYDSYEATDVRRDVTMAYTYVGADGDTMIYGEETLDTNGDGNIAGWWGIGYDIDQSAGIAPNKYQDGNQGCCDGDPDILIYRYSDALLMYAELENEINGPNQTAFDYLNRVRERANASLIPVGGTKDEFRERIYKERFWELSFEHHEVFDVRRLGKVAEAISQSPEAAKVGTTYKPHYELWPIPQSELDANPNLEKNFPEW